MRWEEKLMNKSEYLLEIEKCEADRSKVEQIETEYKCKLDGLITNVISYTDKSIFIDDEERVMSFSEIIQINKDYNNVFINNKMIPVIDCFDGIFIVFILEENKWAKYSTSDLIVYKKRSSLSELI